MHRRLAVGLTAVSLALASTLAAAPAATAAPPDLPDLSGHVLDREVPAVSVGEALAEAVGTVTAFVELDTPSGVEVAEAGGDPADVLEAAARTRAVADDVLPDATPGARSASTGVREVATVSNLLPGVLVVGDAEQVRALADDPNVRAVRLVAERTLDNAAQVEFTRALATWQDTGVLGTDVTVGIIDTGIDYTHATFGGPGTTEAYGTAVAAAGGSIPDGLVDPDKFVGGYDFAGPVYDANGTPAQQVPQPDDNPIDLHGHGTHVAGTTAGYGVTPDGTTFDGDYSALDGVADWPVGPGTAPGAKLYALKVFGDVAGSTALTSLALDLAADPNGDGSFDDRLDVLNLSLGADGSPADDPESAQVAELTALGTTVVLSAGNAGDIEDIGGSPGNGYAGLTVAWSIGKDIAFDAIEVTEASDPALLGRHAGQNSAAYVGADVTAPVVDLDGFDGCEEFSAEQADAVDGKIAFLWWDDDDATRACGSAARFDHAQDAGAVGVLLPTTVPVFAAGIAGNDEIPGFQMTADTTRALLPEIEAGTLEARIGPGLALLARVDVGADTLSSSSSRGVHGSLGWGKPDVAAPGQQIVSAGVGTGNGGASSNGTSMASPHVAGIAALVREARPGWSAAQVKAAIVNTATHDVTTEPGGDLAYGPPRVGSGRVDALAAVTNDTLVYDATRPQQTSVSFGVVPVGGTPVTLRKAVTVQNLGSTARTYSTAVTSSTTSGGARITAAPASLRVPAGGTGIVTLTFTADPATLAREIDPTMATAQLGSLPRDFVSQVSGRLVLTSGSTELRLPVQATPRPTSDLEASDVTLSADGTGELVLTGRDIVSDGWLGFVTPLVHAADSPRLEELPADLETSRSAVRAGDLRHVGWASTAPEVAAAGGDPATGYLGVGIATDGEWAALGNGLRVRVLVDTDRDGRPDVSALVAKLTDADYSVVQTTRLADGEVMSTELLFPFGGDFEIGAFDNQVLTVPVPIGALEIEAGTQVDVTVQTLSGYAPAATGIVDAVGPFTVDPYSPPLWFGSNIGTPLLSVGMAGATVDVHAGTGAEDARILLLHHLNGTGDRAQVVDVEMTPAVATTTSLDVTTTGVAGEETTLQVAVTPREATGTVTLLDGGTVLGEMPLADGSAVLVTQSLGAGSHALQARFTPDTPRFAASSSDVVETGLAPSSSRTTLALRPGQVRHGEAPSATVTVTGRSWAPSGTVTVRDRGRDVATGELVVDGLTGTATIALPRDLGVGAHRLVAVFAGTSDVAGSEGAAHLRVTPGRATVTAETADWSVPRGSRPVVTVRVSGGDGAPAPTGRVAVLHGLRTVGTPRLVDGAVTLTLPEVRGTSPLTVLYLGDGGYLPAATVEVLRVR